MSKLNRIYLLIVTLICLTIFNCKSQNLIANGSFEIYTNPIDCGSGGFDNYYLWPAPHVLDNWYGYQSPDYFNSICPHSLIPGQYGVEVPANLFGYSFARTGNAYAGFILFAGLGDTKEYIHQHLNAPLISGKTYCLSFYVSRADGITHSIHSIGALFSMTAPVMSGVYLPANPQIVNQNGFVTDTAQWTLIQGCFTALGGEQYITIGNFNSNVNTDTLFVGSNQPILYADKYAYYYIDDISLFDQATVGLQVENKKSKFEIYPNPNTGLLKFSNLQYSNGDYNVKILDLFGKEIINEVLKDELDISSFDKGVYTLLLYKNKQLVVTKKVMKD